MSTNRNSRPALLLPAKCLSHSTSQDSLTAHFTFNGFTSLAPRCTLSLTLPKHVIVRWTFFLLIPLTCFTASPRLFGICLVPPSLCSATRTKPACVRVLDSVSLYFCFSKCNCHLSHWSHECARLMTVRVLSLCWKCGCSSFRSWWHPTQRSPWRRSKRPERRNPVVCHWRSHRPQVSCSSLLFPTYWANLHYRCEELTQCRSQLNVLHHCRITAVHSFHILSLRCS